MSRFLMPSSTGPVAGLEASKSCKFDCQTLSQIPVIDAHCLSECAVGCQLLIKRHLLIFIYVLAASSQSCGVAHMSVRLHLNPTGNPLLQVRPRASTFVRYLQAVQTSLVCNGELWLAVLNGVKCLLRDDLQSPSKLQVDGRQTTNQESDAGADVLHMSYTHRGQKP